MDTIAGRRRSQGLNLRTVAGYLVLALPLAGIYGFVTIARQRPCRPRISLFQAVETGDMDDVRAHALTGTNLNALDTEGHTALFNAITDMHYGIANLLLREGASPD